MLAPSNIIRLSSLIEESVVDGPRLRYVIYTEAYSCCPGCHNHQPIYTKEKSLLILIQFLVILKRNLLYMVLLLVVGNHFFKATPWRT